MTNLPKDIYLPELAHTKSSFSVLFITADNTEDLEFFYPYYRFIEAGYNVDVATPNGGAFKGKQGLGLKDTQKLSDIDLNTYSLLYLPGGKAPATLKANPKVLELVKEFVSMGRLVAAVCHGPQILAAAQCISGRAIAAWPEVEGEVEQAGGIYKNEQTVVDGQFITARWPGDLPSHMKVILRELQKNQKTPLLSDAA